MSRTIKAALILAVGLMVAAILNGGVYQIVAQQRGDTSIAYRLNRFTGEVKAVFDWHYISIRPLSTPSPNATPTHSQ